MAEPSDTALWRQAIEICESLEGLEKDAVVERLTELRLSQPLLEKVMQIQNNRSVSHDLLDEEDHQKLLASLQQGTHLLGRNIGGYVLRALIAQGGMSTVYLADHQQATHQKPVAIKLLSPYHISTKAIELFSREQQILAKLSHPSIVSFHHSGLTEDGTHYLVMEYIDQARTIVDYCQAEDLNHREVVELVISLSDVFAYAHDNGVIHRDIKPGNILVNDQGFLKVIDFGIGRLEMATDQTLTQVFTPDAAAPEQLLGQEVTRQSDVFSLGALLLQLLVRQKPLPKTNPKAYHPDQDVAHINQLLQASTLDADLQTIIRTAMHIDPARRYQDMRLLADDLRQWVAQKPIQAAADGWRYLLAKWYARNRLAAHLTGLTLVIALGALLLISSLDQKHRQVSAQRDHSFSLIKAMIDQANPLVTPQQDEASNQALINSLNELTERQQAFLESDAELKQFFFRELGDLYQSKGLYQQALDNYQQAFNALAGYTKPHEDVYLEAELTLAHLTETTGDYEQAKQLGYALLKKLDDLPAADPKHRLSAYYLLTKVHDYLFETDDALGISEQATTWLNQHPDINPVSQSSMYNSMAVLQRKQGNLEQAEQNYRKAIGLLRPFPDERIKLSSTLVNLAILKGRAGVYDESEALFQEAIEVARSVEQNHPHVAMAYLPYATLMRVTGRYQEAREINLQALEVLQLNPRDRSLTTAHSRLVRINLTLLDLPAALHHLSATRESLNPAFPFEHPEVLDSYVLALWALIDQGENAAALRLLAYIDQQPTEKLHDTTEYRLLQVIREYLTGEPVTVADELRVFNQLLQDSAADGLTLEELSEQAAGVSPTGLTAAYIAILQASLSGDVESLTNWCDPGQQWFGSHYAAYKTEVIRQCLAGSEDATHPELRQQLLSWQQAQLNLQDQKDALLRQFTKAAN
jgi:serine/threonine protein kinase